MKKFDNSVAIMLIIHIVLYFYCSDRNDISSKSIFFINFIKIYLLFIFPKTEKREVKFVSFYDDCFLPIFLIFSYSVFL